MHVLNQSHHDDALICNSKTALKPDLCGQVINAELQDIDNGTALLRLDAPNMALHPGAQNQLDIGKFGTFPIKGRPVLLETLHLCSTHQHQALVFAGLPW